LIVPARQFGTLIGLLALCAILWILTPHFMTVSNLLNVAEQTSINAIVAVGMTFVILSGGIDLSVGSIVALSGVVLGTSLQGGHSLAVALPLSLAVGLLCGLANGSLVSWGGLPPFIVTLGTMSIARGAALLFTEGRPVSGFDPSFRVLATGRVGFIPAPVIEPPWSMRRRTSCCRVRRLAATSTRSAATRKRPGCRACRSDFTRR
jgi:ribose transport system permease protein